MLYDKDARKCPQKYFVQNILAGSNVKRRGQPFQKGTSFF
jgi:hypothetical protein